MEVLIAMHGAKHMFVGDLPSNRTDYGNRYELATGVSVSNFARDAGPRSDDRLAISKRGPRGLQPTSKVSQVFHDRYCFVHDQPVLTLAHVEALLNEPTQDQPRLADVSRLIASPSASTSISSSSPSSTALTTRRARADLFDNLSHSQPAIRAQFAKSHLLTPIQLLDTLGSSIEHESVLLGFNYFSMHARCTRLLRALYREFEGEMVGMVGRVDEGEGELLTVVRFVFMGLVREEREEGERRGRGFLGRVEGVVRMFVQKEGEVEIESVREEVVRAGARDGGAVKPLVYSSDGRD
jgi:hypothetical protein